MKILRLLLATDFSPCARQAYAPAVDLAHRVQGAIELVRCADHPFHYAPMGFQSFEGAFQGYRELLRRQLEEEARSRVFEGLRLRTHLVSGYGPEAIQRLAVEVGADLVVQGSHGYSGFKRLLVGSFAERVLRLAAVPVLTFRSRGDEGTAADRLFRPRRILFPYDFSPCARRALEPLRLLADLYGSRVLVLHAWQSMPDFLPVYGAGAEAIAAELTAMRMEMPERLGRDLKEFAARDLEGLEHEEVVVPGDPPATILARAAAFEADLICMSTHGWTGLKHLLLGSVAEKVVRGASCPTLTIRPDGDVDGASAPGGALPQHPL